MGGVDIFNKNNDIVCRPSYYTEYGIEPIDFILSHQLNFCLGNVIKYVIRAGRKNKDTELEDLQKARQYLDFAIQRKMKAEKEMLAYTE